MEKGETYVSEVLQWRVFYRSIEHEIHLQIIAFFDEWLGILFASQLNTV